MSERAWRLSGLSILIVGALVRLYHLSLVPLHHDEGVNGNFLVPLVRNGTYTYDPNNYHGPTLYYFSAIIPWVTRFLGGKQFGDTYGLTTFNIRLVTAVFGVATIALALLLRKRLGTIGALSAAALIAISPGAVYLSRYFIHESLFVFFTLGVVVAALRYYDTGAPVYLILAAISAALMVATKETWIINGPVLLIAFITTDVFTSLRKRKAPRLSIRLLLGLLIGAIAGVILAGLLVLIVATFSSLISLGGGYLFVIFAGAVTGALIGSLVGVLNAFDRFGGLIPIATVVLVAFTVFIVVNVLFYSSFFTNYPKGVSDALQTLALWRKRTHEHGHPFLQYFEWLRQMEPTLLLLGTLGALMAVWRGSNRTALFLAQWAFGLLVAYSLVRYKTPWISLNFIVPLALVSGYALNELYKRSVEIWVPLALIVGTIPMLAFGRLIQLERGDAGAITGVRWDFNLSAHWLVFLTILGLGLYAGYILYSRSDGERKRTPHFYVTAVIVIVLCSYQLYQLNFVHYDNDQYVYVYAHTRRETLVMLDQIDRIATKMNTGRDTGIALVSPEYWPLPWYFRDYKRVGYYQKVVPTTEPIIIGASSQEEEIKATYGEEYVKIDSAQLGDPRVDPERSPGGNFSLRPGVDLVLYVRRDVAR